MDKNISIIENGQVRCGYILATKTLKTWRKSIFLENMITENHENTSFAIQGITNLIREGGRTVGSGRVATIIE